MVFHFRAQNWSLTILITDGYKYLRILTIFTSNNMQADNLKPSFFRSVILRMSNQQKTAFDNLKTVSVTHGWIWLIDADNQFGNYRSGSDTYTKNKGHKYVNETRQTYLRKCTFQWVYQPTAPQPSRGNNNDTGTS